MRYLLSCSCGENIPVSKSQAGTQATCPRCQAQLEVPTIRKLTNLPVESEPLDRQQSPAQALPTKTVYRWFIGLLAGVVFLTAFVNLLMGGLIAMDLFAIRKEVNVKEIESWTVDQEVEYGNKMVAAYSNSDLFDVWEDYKTLGLAYREPPQHFVLQRQLLDAKNRMQRYLAIGTVSAICFGLIIVVSRRFNRTTVQ